MEWTPPPDGIAVCQGGGVTNPRRRIMGWTPPTGIVMYGRPRCCKGETDLKRR